MDIQNGAHQIGATVPHFPQLVHGLVRLLFEYRLPGQPGQGGHFQDHGSSASRAGLTHAFQLVALQAVLQINLNNNLLNLHTVERLAPHFTLE